MFNNLSPTQCGLTVLTTLSDKRAVKKFSFNRVVQKWHKEDFDAGFEFRAMEVSLNNIDDLAGLVTDLACQTRCFLVRGELQPWARDEIAKDPSFKIYRRKNKKADGKMPGLQECNRRWMMVDIDDWAMKENHDLQESPELVIEDAIRELLPECFWDVRCFWQLSNSSGFSADGLKVHIFYWLSAPIANDDLRNLCDVVAPGICTSVFNAVQPHFVAGPIIIGGPDPMPRRLGWCKGTEDEVVLPPIPARTYTSSGSNSGSGMGGSSSLDKLAFLGDGEKLWGFHRPVREACMVYARELYRGAPRDDAEFARLVIERVNAAPRKQNRDISTYINPDEIQRQIDGAIEYIEAEEGPIPEPQKPVEPVQPGVKPITISAVPWPFEMRESGLWHHTLNKEGEKVETHICQVFEIVGRTVDQHHERPGTLIRWIDEQGYEHEYVVSDDLVHADRGNIVQELSRRNFRLVEIGAAAYGPLKAMFNSLRLSRTIVSYDRAGWQADGTLFLLPNGQGFGPSADDSTFVNKKAVSYLERGTLAGWQDNVAKFAAGNSRLVLALSTAFVGPLIEMVGAEFSAFHFVGPSSIGKSTALYLAGSVWGMPDVKDQIRQWRATDNGLEGAAQETSDTLMILDEMGQAPVESLGDIVYMLGNGSGKSRAARDGSARQVNRWRVSVLSSGEHTLESAMRAKGRRDVPAGLDVRMINVAADAGCRMGLFQDCHGMTPEEFAKHLKAESRANYGTAARAYLEAVLATRAEDEEDLIKTLRSQTDDFVKAHAPHGADGQVLRVIGKFGLAAVAGELAVACSILPWATGEATSAAVACLRDWLSTRGTHRPKEESDMITKVRSFILSHGDSRFENLDDKNDCAQIRDRAGFIQDGQYHITGDEFAKIVSPMLPAMAAKVLERDGLIEVHYRENRKTGEKTAEYNPPRKYDGKQVRTYKILDRILST